MPSDPLNDVTSLNDDPGSSRAAPTVLVVEDDAPLAHLYCVALARRGIHAVHAEDGVSALRALGQERPDLILLDLMLPAASGSTVLRKLAANPLTSDIAIIVVTGVECLPDLP